MLLALQCSRAFAETAPSAGTVILLQPAAASSAIRRSLARVRDELAADRFHVVIAESSAPGDPTAAIGTVSRDMESGSVLVLFGDPDTGQAELCLAQYAAGRSAVRRAVVVDDPERIPEALAKRALELLRATELELSIEVEPAPPAPKPPDARPQAEIRTGAMPPARARETPIVAVDAGVGVWTGVDGPPPAAIPFGRVGLRLSERLWARGSVAGLGTRPRLETAYGSATVSQLMALVECAAIFRRDRRVRPTLSLGAGVLNVAVAGTGAAPYEGRDSQRWSAAFDGGAGVELAVGSSVGLVTEIHALVASPHPVVRFVDTRAATIGYPSLILSLALRVGP